jgi:hypothetical protein
MCRYLCSGDAVQRDPRITGERKATENTYWDRGKSCSDAMALQFFMSREGGSCDVSTLPVPQPYLPRLDIRHECNIDL